MTNISYNKQFVVRDGQALLVCTNSDGENRVEWLMTEPVMKELLALRKSLLNAVAKQAIVQFAIMGGSYSVKTQSCRMGSGERVYTVSFAERGVPGAKQAMMTPEKFEQFLNCVEHHANGGMQDDDGAMEVQGMGDLEEMKLIAFNWIFGRKVMAAMRDKCFGCQNNRASQKEHDVCLMGGGPRERIRNEVLIKMAEREEMGLVDALTVLAMRVWVEMSGNSVSFGAGNVQALLHLKDDSDFDLEEETVRERGEDEGRFDPGKTEAFKRLAASAGL